MDSETKRENISRFMESKLDGVGSCTRGADRLEKMQRPSDKKSCEDTRLILGVGDNNLWLVMVVVI